MQSDKHCDKCGKKTVLVFYAAEEVTRGFFCWFCKNFDPAIGREKQFKPEVKR
mgnify:FL=1|jgi:hypothetical protein